MTVLPRNFYTRDPVTVARELLGKYLVRRAPGRIVCAGIINEVEAYLSEGDEAAHGFRGKNERNASLFLSGGHAYVHTQRHHTLIDIVTLESGEAGSVLLRSVIPMIGIEYMKIARGRAGETIASLTDGPAKICQAFSITKGDDGIDVTNPKSTLRIEDHGIRIRQDEVSVTPRIGIGKAKEKPLRFVFMR